MKTIRLPLIFFLFFISIGQIYADNLDLPSVWPWQGVSIDSRDFDPSELKSVVQRIKINSVQLRLNSRKLAAEKRIGIDEAWSETRQWAESMLNECKKLGIVAIISIEGFPRSPKVQYSQNSPAFWNNQKNIDDVLEFAEAVSKYFSGRGDELAAYQFISEPVMVVKGKALRPPNLRAFQSDLIRIIRSNDLNRWIAIAPGPWGGPGGYRDFKPFPFKKIVYGAHMYLPHAFTHQGIRKYKERYTYPGVIKGRNWDKEKLVSTFENLRRFQLKHEVPVWIGEFSAINWARGGDVYIKDVVSIFNEYGWSWTYFSLNGWHGWNPNFNDQLPVPMRTWKSHYVGIESKRWDTLQSLFNGKK